MPDIAKESNITKKLNSLISPKYLTWKITTTSRGGMPDCLYIGTEDDLWIEFKRSPTVLKIIHAYKHNICYGLSKLQNKTLKQLYEYGKIVWVVIYTPIGFYILKNRMWEKPIATSHLRVYDVYELAKEIHATIGDPNVPLNQPRSTCSPNNIV